jgi:hypothetical protein
MAHISAVGFSDDLKSLRARLRNMSDAELLQFGRAARYMCSPKANMGKAPLDAFVVQLNEARAEWKRRKDSAAK